MNSKEAKKLTVLRILQILRDYSDSDHIMTREQIAAKMESLYGVRLERQAVSRNLSFLQEAGFEIESSRRGAYLKCRDFEDAELRMLIDGVLSSSHITAKQSEDLIGRICELSNKYFKPRINYVHSVHDWSKTENQSLFYNIEVIDEAIEQGKRVAFNYNKYGKDKKLHKSSKQELSPYMMLLHNQRYYLMGYNEYWGNMAYRRLDRITDIKITDKQAIPLRKVPGFEKGIDYKMLSTALPYMFSDKPERIEFLAEETILDQVVDWLGRDIIITDCDDPGKVHVSVIASPNAMSFWAMQYLNYIEILSPQSLRNRIKESLEKGFEKYAGDARKS